MRALILIAVLSEWSLVSGDFDCLCNYNVEEAVYPTADSNGQPLGYLYEFDCKPLTKTQANTNNMYTIQFEKQVGYVVTNQQVQVQTCPGEPPATDIIPWTTKTHVSTTEQTTISSNAATSSTPLATSQASQTTTTATTRMTTTTPTTTRTTTPLPTTTRTTRATTPQPSTTQTTTQATTTTTKPTTTTVIMTSTTSTVAPTTQSTITTTRQPTTSMSTSSTIKSTTPFTTMKTTPFMYWSMAANVLGTPYQYVGIGYNLLNGNPEAFTDPGYLTSQRIFQLTGNSTSVREAVYRKYASCNTQTDTLLLYGSKAYQDELKGLVQPSSSHNAHLMESAFTDSTHFDSMRQALDRGDRVYIDKITTCSYGDVRYATDNANSGNFTVSREFAKDVCALPESMNASNIVEFVHFLDNWGTSIVTSVKVGTKSLNRYQTTPAQVLNHVEQTDSKLIQHSGPYEGFPSSILINTQDYPHSTAAVSAIGARHTTSIGTVQHQIPVSAELVPISDALNWAYWKPILDELVAEGICSDKVYTSHLTPYLQSITMALNQYPAIKKAQHNYQHHALVDRPAIQAPITWPAGTYGLMKAAGGCPAGNTRWQEGWRKFDTEDTRSHNSFTPAIQNYLSGEFHSSDIVNRFCMKTSSHSISGGQYDQQWPKGSYCLLKKGSCPSGFGSGYIFWDDEDLSNHNAKGGSLPDGTYDKNTKIYYCCRNDGSPTTKLILPIDKPFVMMRYGRTCQAVYGMSVHEIYVSWDDEDLFNKDKASGMHPLDDGGSSNHRIHFCYYQSAAGPGLIG